MLIDTFATSASSTAIAALSQRLVGEAIGPKHPEYDAARRGWPGQPRRCVRRSGA